MSNAEKVTCFLPCRAGSERIPKKNIKPFAAYDNGIIELKINQLLAVDLIDRVVLSTDDLEILEYAESLCDHRIFLHRRIEELSASYTSTDQLVAHAYDLIPDGHILWTHTTSPFISSKIYSEIIIRYFHVRELGYDSLMTTKEIHGFLWKNGKPLNYDRALEKWPRTQTLKGIHEINSGVFLSPSQLYALFDDRIGQKPYLYELDKIESFDIDWPEDFLIAECLVEKGLVLL